MSGPGPAAGYAELVAKVDALSARVAQRHPEGLRCGPGCSACCHQHLTLLPIEVARITAAVAALAVAARAALRARLAAGSGDSRCPLLAEDGRCLTYEARPMICRTHGLPIQVGQPPRRDVCPLNFPDGPALEALDADVVLDVERLNTVLGLIDRLQGGDGSRVDLWQALVAAQNT